MKLEYLSGGSPDCPLIRMYEFTPNEAIDLKAIFDCLANGAIIECALHEQKGVEPVAGCQLNLRVGSRDRGIHQLGPLAFECMLTTEGWFEVADLAEPFCKNTNKGSFQWLNADGPISLLLSPSGKW